MFYFKQFSVDQHGCAMKVNTDGVLLGALAQANCPATILDLGTGTGVIALMLAQRYAEAKIDAVEIDEQAALTAGRNFKNSYFADRLKVHSLSFAHYFEQYSEREYDLIVSNPPFYINALRPPENAMLIAKHADAGFLERLVRETSVSLSKMGLFCLILPPAAAALVNKQAAEHGLYLQKLINIRSFDASPHHRELLTFGRNECTIRQDNFTIYKSTKVYSDAYRSLLSDFLTIF